MSLSLVASYLTREGRPKWLLLGKLCSLSSKSGGTRHKMSRERNKDRKRMMDIALRVRVKLRLFYGLVCID